MDKEMQDYKTMDLLKERRTKFEKGQQILDVSADLMGNRIRRQEKGWVAPKEDRNKKPGRVGGDGLPSVACTACDLPLRWAVQPPA